ncbi:MAG: shikimate dehydrogenase [Maribacter sp.]|nr:shikimate dehydrogenase [Maribacter sp.]
METIENKKILFGLVGRNIAYSFSKGYFTQKFAALGLANHNYENFDLPSIEAFPALIKNTEGLKGLNVTIPYKQSVIPYLNQLSRKAKEIGAVNTIQFNKTGLKGYNTDVYGFKKSIKPYLKKQHVKALILGTGGASKAVAYVLGELGISYKFVSRSAKKGQFTYDAISEKILQEYTIIINCSPVGTFPNSTEKPQISYEYLGPKHLLYDLIYNPSKTAFLKEGEARGARICNGLKMLEYQAEKAWEIWRRTPKE